MPFFFILKRNDKSLIMVTIFMYIIRMRELNQTYFYSILLIVCVIIVMETIS